MKIKNIKLSEKWLIYLFAITYMVSYITRKNFGAVISEIELQTGIERTLLSLSLTGSFITYAIGQIISGIIGDRFSPKKLVFYGLITTVITNFALSISKDPYTMLVIWCVNGFAQAFMWPPLVRLMIGLLTTEAYKKAAVTVSCGSSVGSIIVFIISPIVIAITGWRGVFVVSGMIGIFMCLIWQMFSPDVENSLPKKSKEKKGEKSNNSIISVGFLLLLFATCVMGMLREGVETWMPSYIYDTFDMSNLIAILSGVLLPIFAAVSYKLTAVVYEKKFTSPLLCSGVIFIIGSAAALILFLLSGRSAIAAIILMALITGCMHGVSLMLTAMAPPLFAGEGKVSTVSGIINSCTYAGSAISTYLVAAFTESRGWNFTVLIWLIMTILGVAFSFGAAILNKENKK